jgi:hypothetical protein
MLASKEMEKELLGGETKVYNSDRWVHGALGNSSLRRKADIFRFVRPTYAVTPSHITK